MNIRCRLQDLNPPPDDYKSSALPDELSRQTLNCKGLRAIELFYVFRNSVFVPQFRLFSRRDQLTFTMPNIPLRHFFIGMSKLISGCCHSISLFLVRTCFSA